VDAWAWRTATDLTAALRRREVSSRELLAAYLDRVARLGGRVNAVVTLDERAPDEAAAADEATARGESLGPLHGLPVTVKDSIETVGLRTTSGSADLADHVPARDATAVSRLRAAGAIVFGKTNTPEYAGRPDTTNALFGTTTNPWDAGRSPGGSSGGPAAAVAAGLTGLDLGSDLGGSVRMPAGYCGVYGLRPSYGLVPTRGHIPPPPGARDDPDMSTLGPLARGADDLGLALDVLAGPDAARAVAWRLELPPPRAPVLSEYRVAVWLDDRYSPVAPDVLDVLSSTVDVLRAAGVKVDDTARPVDLGEAARLFQRLAQPVLAHGLPAERFQELCVIAASDATTRHAEWARNVTQRVRDRSLAHERRLELVADWARLFRDHDVLLCPVTPTTALPLAAADTPQWFEQVRWTQAISAAYLPAASVPVGVTKAGLPVGLQVVGPYLEDRSVVDVARRVAEVVGGYLPPPGW
jgi:amidase